VRVERPGPGEELNLGDVTPARPAASLILLRDTPEGPEVLLVQRAAHIRFMGGMWVFPGGAVDDEDADPATTAVREAEEEVGLVVERDALVPFSRWVTPRELKRRYDTWFFVAEAPAGEVVLDPRECVDHRWIRPEAALGAYQRGEMPFVFPTLKHLEELAAFASVAEVLEAGRTREITPVEPRVAIREGGADVLLPGEPGYDELG
jgi:8-oxo-dGTP pyrophosphatase MutT (NUDIX family)